jgi:hypothetical protein
VCRRAETPGFSPGRASLKLLGFSKKEKQMKPENAKEEFEKYLKSCDLDLKQLTPSAGVKAMLSLAMYEQTDVIWIKGLINFFFNGVFITGAKGNISNLTLPDKLYLVKPKMMIFGNSTLILNLRRIPR